MSLGSPDEQRADHPDVAAALERLAALDTLSVAEHIAVYDEVQQRLGAAMDGTEMNDAQLNDAELSDVGDPRLPTGPG